MRFRGNKRGREKTRNTATCGFRLLCASKSSAFDRTAMKNWNTVIYPYNIRDIYVFSGEIGGKIKFDGGKRLYKGERVYLYSELFLIFKLFGWKIVTECVYIYIWKIDCSNWNYICLVIWKIKIVGWNIIRLLKLLSLTKSKSNETFKQVREYIFSKFSKKESSI